MVVEPARTAHAVGSASASASAASSSASSPSATPNAISSSGVSERCARTSRPHHAPRLAVGAPRGARSPGPAPSCRRATRPAGSPPRPRRRSASPLRPMRRGRRRPRRPPTGDTQADQRADRRPQLGPLLIVQIGHAQHRGVFAVAHHEHGVDDPDLADVTQTCQFVGDPTLEQVAVREADDECLDGSDAHGGYLLRYCAADRRHDAHPEHSGRRAHHTEETKLRRRRPPCRYVRDTSGLTAPARTQGASARANRDDVAVARTRYDHQAASRNADERSGRQPTAAK